jgi:hypothetical protein
MRGGSKPGERRGGRKAGTPNKATAELQGLARKHTKSVLVELVRLATEAESEQARVAACKEVLDRGYGRAAQAVTGAGGEELNVIHRVIHEDAHGEP